MRWFRPQYFQSPFQQRFIGGLKWSFVATIASQFFGVLTSVAVARTLGIQAFGEYGAIQSTIGMLGVFAGLGLGMTSSRYVARDKLTSPGAATDLLASMLLLGVVSAVLTGAAVIIFGSRIATEVLNSPNAVNSVRWSALLLVVNAVQGIHVGALSGLEDFTSISWITTARGAMQVVAVPSGALFGGVEGATMGLVGAGAVSLILSDRTLRKAGSLFNISVYYFTCKIQWRTLMVFSLPAVICNVVLSPATWIVNVWLLAQPGGKAELGALSAASFWRNAIVLLPNVVGQVMVPMTASMEKVGDEAIFGLMRRAVVLNALTAVPAALVLGIFSRPIMSFYGPQFSDRGPVLAITGVAAILVAVQSPFGNVLTGTGRMWLGALMNAVTGVTFAAMSYLLLSGGMGADGVAYAFVFGNAVNAIWSYALVRRTERRGLQRN